MRGEHLSMTAEHFTPKYIAGKVHAVMGGIDLDPCSHNYANTHLIRATRFFTLEEDGLKYPWVGKIYVNAPGDLTGKVPQRFWRKLAAEVAEGNTKEFCWMGFNLSHLRTLQNVSHTLLMESNVCVFKQRIRYTGNYPTKDNCMLYWGPNTERFVEQFRPMGAIWIGK